MAEITDLWVENSQKNNGCDVTSIQEGRAIVFILFKKYPDVSNYFKSLINLSLCFCFFLSSFFFSFSLFKKYLIISNYSVLNVFLFSSDIKGYLIFCFLALLSFCLLPSTICLGMFVLKRPTILSSTPPTLFVIGSGI